MKNNYLQTIKTIIVLLVLLLACFVSANANPVDHGRARQVAANFLNINRSADLMDISAEAGFTNVYVFTTEKSFVLLAADDRVQPILGYSLNGSFDVENMPDNKRTWIQEYSDAIQYAIDNSVSATSEVAQQWSDLAEGLLNRSALAVVVGPLLSTTWDQDSPYNYLCPGLTVTGCAATAMAQVMKYWNYPSHGVGTHSYTLATYGVQSADFQNTTYNWTNMINSYSGSYNSTQRDAVATLMYHCGVSVDMDYGTASTGGSSASANAPAYALVNYFNYSSSVQYCSRSSYAEDEWLYMLQTELNQGRPIFYHGSGNGGGHAFVFDGYNTSNYFHVNWGWSGYCDEYYLVSNLNPGPGGIGSGSNGIYNSNQGAIIGIKPSTCTASAPTNLNATTSGRNVTLTWTAASGAASYNVYCNSVQIGNATSTSFTHLAPYGGATYYVRSVNSNGDMSMSSNVASVTLDYPQPVVNDLTASVSGSNVTLNWTAPDWCYPTTPTATLTYGDGTHEGSIGASSYNLYWGHRYPASSLSSYNNMYVYKVSFYANNTGSYRVHVYQGSSGNYAQTQLLQQNVFVGKTGWFDIDLSTPIQIDASKDLWVFMYDPENRTYPCAANYTTNDEGDYLSISPTSQMQHNSGYTWLIRTFVSDGTYTYNLYRNGSSIATNLSSTTYNDNGLADGTYNYYVKTNYYAGQSNQSNTATAVIEQQNYETLTVYDGTDTNSNLPAFIFYFDFLTRSQFVIPAEDLVEMIGRPIYSMTFYTTSQNVPYTTVSNADVYLKEVDYTWIDEFEPKSSASIVYSGYFYIVNTDNGGKMTINFSTPYVYQGGNLLVGIDNTEANGWKAIYFYGQDIYGASISNYDDESLENVMPVQMDFIPKTTFGFLPPCEKSLPYTYGFEEQDEFDYWTMLHCHSNSGISTNSTHQGNKSFRFRWNTTPPQYLISPLFEGTTGMKVSFYYKIGSNNYPESFQVGYSTTTRSPNAFTWGDEMTVSDASTWMYFEDIFPVGTKYVAVKLNSNDEYYLYLDDFSFTPVSSSTQTIALSAGTNWTSFNVDITLDDLKAALVDALSGTGTIDITIQGKSQNTKYTGGRWRGNLTFDVTQMYMIDVSAACEITLVGAPVNSSERPITIVNGANWIAYPLNVNMTQEEAFAGFNVVNGDVISSKGGNARYTGGRWRGTITLTPGQGYIYNSAASGSRTLTFPSGSK